ncbi:hypothetical protein WN943_004404 [Citrus x changshan-huyou]
MSAGNGWDMDVDTWSKFAVRPMKSRTPYLDNRVAHYRCRIFMGVLIFKFLLMVGELLKVSEGQISPASVENATLENDKMIREEDEEHIKAVLFST